MTIDPAHPEKYRLRNGCEVVRINENPDGSLVVDFVRSDGNPAWTVLAGDGKHPRNDSDLDLVPATTDPEEQA